MRRYIEAHERGDPEAVVALLHDEVRITMPPWPPCRSHPAAVAFFRDLFGPDGPGEWLLLPTRANGLPATANYLRRPGDAAYRALSIDVLDVRDQRLVAIHCFLDDRIFPSFGLPTTREPS